LARRERIHFCWSRTPFLVRRPRVAHVHIYGDISTWLHGVDVSVAGHWFRTCLNVSHANTTFVLSRASLAPQCDKFSTHAPICKNKGQLGEWRHGYPTTRVTRVSQMAYTKMEDVTQRTQWRMFLSAHNGGCSSAHTMEDVAQHTQWITVW
jgi:hypothetical protein